MRSLQKKLGAAVIAAAITGLVLAGCSSGGTPIQSASGVALPYDQQNLTFVPDYAVEALDITQYPLEPGVQEIARQILEPLLKFGSNGTTLRPALATSWTWTAPTQLTFTLRKGVKFSDGQPFTSADVKGSFDRYISKKGALAPTFATITSYSAPDPHTFVINTKAPDGTLPGVLTLVLIGEGAHSHSTLSSEDNAWWQKPVGTGPFVVSDYVPNDHIRLTRNDSYWGTKAKLKTLTVDLITDPNAKITALSNNQAQVVQDLTSDQITQIKGNSGVKITSTPSYTYYFVWFENSTAIPLTNPLVRKAMYEALDLPSIAKSLFGDTAKAMTSFCPSAAFGCVAPNGPALPSYNPKDAKALLAKAGYPNGFTIDMIWNTSTAVVQQYAQPLIAAWKAIGVTVTPRAEDGTTWHADFNALKWDMDTQATQDNTGDADYVLNRLYSCASKRLGYCDPSLDSVLTQAQQSTDSKARLALYQKAVNILAKDVPAIPLFETEANVAASTSVHGLVLPPNEYVDFSSVYLSK